MSRRIQSAELLGASPKMMTVSEARACMIADIPRLPAQTVPLRSALGRVLAIYASLQQPGGEAEAWRLATLSFLAAICGLAAAAILNQWAQRRLAG